MTNFDFSHNVNDQQELRSERFFSFIPGFLSWSILLGMIFLSFYKPLLAALLIIAYDIYWLLRLFYMTIFMVVAYAVLAIEEKTDWKWRCQVLMQKERGLQLIKEKRQESPKIGIRKRLSYRNQERELKRVIAQKIEIPSYDSIYHLVIVPVYREPREVIEPNLKGLARSQFPTSRMIIVLAVEERSGEEKLKMLEDLRSQYSVHFRELMIVVHPKDLPGEERVKGANVTFAAQKAHDWMKEKKIAIEQVVVSCFDSDTVAKPEYFAALTYHFMRHPHRLRASYQPIPVYHNNIWEAPGFARVLETGASFFQLIEVTNPEKLVTFSSHSMSFKALVEIGYWPVDMISDDSAIFWKAYNYYDGDYRVVPMYVTLSMDVVMAGSLWETLKSVYRQKRRWAWGVENFPIVMRAFCHNKNIRFGEKLRSSVKLIEMHVSWATVGFLVTFIGWLPAIFAGQEFSSSVVLYNSSRITSLIFNLASTALIVSIALSMLLLPKRREKHPVLKRLLVAFEWLFVPLVFTFLSTLPALDAQTRLMFGVPLQFQATEKQRRRKSSGAHKA